jgi:hypothetical protein
VSSRLPSAALVGAIVLAGCSEYLALPEATPPPGVTACDTTGLAGPLRLAGDSDAVPHVWAVGPDGERVEVTWPPGFKSVFWPELLVLDEESRTVGHENDDLAAPPDSFDGLVVCVGADGVAVWREADLR